MDTGYHEIGQGSPLELSSPKEKIFLIRRHTRLQALVADRSGSLHRCRLAGHRIHPYPCPNVRLTAGRVTGRALRLRALKHVVREAHSLDLVAAMEMELSAYNRLFKTADRREGVASFNEKRTPAFRGE